MCLMDNEPMLHCVMFGYKTDANEVIRCTWMVNVNPRSSVEATWEINFSLLRREFDEFFDFISMPEGFLLWKLKRLGFLCLMENAFNRSGCVSHGCKWLKEFSENFASDSRAIASPLFEKTSIRAIIPAHFMFCHWRSSERMNASSIKN